MTTIAYDGKTLCADSLVSTNDWRFGLVNKIHRVNGGYLALCGDWAAVHQIAIWAKGGDRPAIPDGGFDVSGIFISSDGEAFELSPSLDFFPACIPWSGGSGLSIAMAVMKHGGTAREAIKIACDIDKNSGLPVRAVKIKKCTKA